MKLRNKRLWPIVIVKTVVSQDSTRRIFTDLFCKCSLLSGLLKHVHPDLLDRHTAAHIPPPVVILCGESRRHWQEIESQQKVINDDFDELMMVTAVTVLMTKLVTVKVTS